MYITQIWPMQSCFPTIFSILTLLLIVAHDQTSIFYENHLPSDSHANSVYFFLMRVGYLSRWLPTIENFFFVSGFISMTCMCYSRPANLMSHKTATDQMEERMRKRYRLELVIINRIGHALVTLGCSSYNITTRRNRSLAINVYASTSAPS